MLANALSLYHVPHPVAILRCRSSLACCAGGTTAAKTDAGTGTKASPDALLVTFHCSSKVIGDADTEADDPDAAVTLRTSWIRIKYAASASKTMYGGNGATPPADGKSESDPVIVTIFIVDY